MAGVHEFVHLHTESEYGFPDGMCRPEALAERAAGEGYPAAGLVDRATLHGTFAFYDAMKARGVKPLLGCELSVASGGAPPGLSSMTFFAESWEGWHRLVRLVSRAHLDAPEGGDPAVSLDRVDALRGGLLLLWNPGSPEAARNGSETARRLAEIVGADRFYLEHRLESEGPAVRADGGLPADFQPPTVVTASVQYVGEAEAWVHAHVRALRGAEPAGTNTGVPFLSAPEMRARCPDMDEERERTLEIASRCTVEFPREAALQFPHFEIPPGFTCGEGPPGHREFSFLRATAAEGLRARYGDLSLRAPGDRSNHTLMARFQHELEIIRHAGYIHYFLVVWDIVRFARLQGIAVGPGRGSGAASLVAYALGITDIDPVRYGLVFERFLNPERVSPPDFDIDFDPVRRPEVIAYLRERYGHERVAHIVTFQRFGARQAVRDAARVLGRAAADADRLARRVPEEPPGGRGGAAWRHPDVRQAALDSPADADVYRLARGIEGIPRNTGTHAAGIVVGDQPLEEQVPLMRDRSGQVMTQVDMDSLERTGLLKMDLLGLTTLSVVDETLRNIVRGGGTAPDLAALPGDDAATFDRLARGETAGIFQLESPGMQDLLRRVRVTRFEDLVAILALYRPGPMHLLDAYIKGEGEAADGMDHPLLEPILSETRGVMLYQEQVQQAAHVLAGFSMAEGDLLRRAMGKKDRARMAAKRTAFLDGCRRLHRIPAEQAGRIFDAMERFAGYGFNKAHSVAYATLSYRCAWLKTHHPQAFMAAWLSSQTHDTDRMRAGFLELRALGCGLRPPEINRSEVRFIPEGRALRYGLAAIRHIGMETADAIVAERGARGPFPGLVDFCIRTHAAGLNRVAVESLVKAGAFDGAGRSRARLLAGLEAALHRAARLCEDRDTGQLVLFEDDPLCAGDETLPRAGEEAWTREALAEAEQQVLGVCLGVA